MSTAVDDTHRHHAFAVAYRMTGSVADADDAAQEALLRLHQAEPAPDDARAWLSTVTTRLCLDRLRSAQVRRETYVGPWLPEPLLADGEDTPDALVLAETVSLALLHLLERLSPAERAAFILHDAFGFGHAELAEALGRSEPACRQLLSRARRAVAAERPRFEPDPAHRTAIAQAFLAAAAGDDLDALVGMLTEDAVLRADAAGERPSPRKPVVGAGKVARALFGFRKRGLEDNPEAWEAELLWVNGTPGLLLREDGRPDTLLAVDVAGDRVGVVHLFRSKAKLDVALRRRDAGG